MNKNWLILFIAWLMTTSAFLIQTDHLKKAENVLKKYNTQKVECESLFKEKCVIQYEPQSVIKTLNNEIK